MQIGRGFIAKNTFSKNVGRPPDPGGGNRKSSAADRRKSEGWHVTAVALPGERRERRPDTSSTRLSGPRYRGRSGYRWENGAKKYILLLVPVFVVCYLFLNFVLLLQKETNRMECIDQYFACWRSVHAVRLRLWESSERFSRAQGAGRSDYNSIRRIKHPGTLGGRVVGRQTVGRLGSHTQRGRHHGRTIDMSRLRHLLVPAALCLRRALRHRHR